MHFVLDGRKQTGHRQATSNFLGLSWANENFAAASPKPVAYNMLYCKS